MKITIHAENPLDAAIGLRAIQTAEKAKRHDVVYAYGDSEEFVVWVRLSKSGYIANVTSKGKPSEQ